MSNPGMTLRAHDPALPLAPTDSSELVALLLGALSENTRKAYAQALGQFSTWAGFGDVRVACGQLLAAGQGQANAAALRWRTYMVDVRKFAPKTVNAKLAAVRSVVKLARQVGLVTWALDVDDVKAEALRDTRGPGTDAVRAVYRLLEREIEDPELAPTAARDLAMIRLLYDLALRRFEVVGLDLEHVDFLQKTVDVLAKGRRERRTYTLPDPTAHALAGWVSRRGAESGPLFGSLGSRPSRDGRLNLNAVNRLVGARGRQALAERPVKPHGLRHTAITDALDRTDGDVRRVRAFSRHANVQTLMLYDDARRDHQGEVAKIVAEGTQP